MKASLKGPLMALGALAVAGIALAVIALGNLGQNLVYYWSPRDMVAQGEKAFGPTIRLGGLVVPGSIQWNPAHTGLNFKVADSEKPDAITVDVLCDQVPPQMFREKVGVVVEGTYDASKVFKTSRLMVNHSNEYKPPKSEQEFKEMMQKMTPDEMPSQAKR
jgi:cytochrome c-type biogenesis protein CcmE